MPQTIPIDQLPSDQEIAWESGQSITPITNGFKLNGMNLVFGSYTTQFNLTTATNATKQYAIFVGNVLFTFTVTDVSGVKTLSELTVLGDDTGITVTTSNITYTGTKNILALMS
jgi:hypothetical protein